MIEVTTEEGVWKVRKPLGREVLVLQKLNPDSLDSDESFDVIKQVLEKVIISGPEEFRMNGKYDLEQLPADTFFTLFFESCNSTLKVLGKFQ